MIRVLVIDDLKLIHKGLEAMFAADKEIEIVGFAANGKEAISQIQNSSHHPDIVLVDILMPIMDGIETTKEISKLFPKIKVIVLTSFEDEPIILQAIASGAKGYLLKNAISQDLKAAIISVHRGAAHFAPGILNSITKTVQKNTLTNNSKILPQSAYSLNLPTNNLKIQTVKPKKNKKTPNKKQKPLFEHGDWLTIIISVIVLSQTDGMGHHLAHAGLFCLMVSLIARPIKTWWNWPLKNRRAIGIFAFAASVAHAFYATFQILDLNWTRMVTLSSQSKLGIILGIISLLAMTPAALTSFQVWQQKLGKTWRQIHLLTVPALALATIHTILVGPHYLATFNLEAIDYFRTFFAAALGVLVLLMRRKFFWTTIKLK